MQDASLTSLTDFKFPNHRGRRRKLSVPSRPVVLHRHPQPLRQPSSRGLTPRLLSPLQAHSTCPLSYFQTTSCHLALQCSPVSGAVNAPRNISSFLKY